MYEPESLYQFVGQKRTLQQVAVSMKAAAAQGTPFPHTLLSGFGGTGKTTLAKLIASTLGVKFIMKMPLALKNEVDVWSLFDSNMVDDSPILFFIDEIHRLDVKIEEELYIPMENQIILRRSGPSSVRGVYELKPFTLIGATTNPGKLTEPFRSRFGLNLQMEPYTDEDMTKLVNQAAEETDREVEDEAVAAIIARSRSSPRLANHLLDRCNDMKYTLKKGVVDTAVAETTFQLMGIDESGLNETDRKYLEALYNALRPIGPMSLEPLLHIDRESIVKSIEPYLVQQGWVTLTGRGRELTRKGVEFVEQGLGHEPQGLTRRA